MDFSVKQNNRHHHQRHSHNLPRCILVSVAVLLAVGILIAILAATVFRVRETTTTVNSVKLTNLHAGFDISNLSVELNVKLNLDITATNPNAASFKYPNGGVAEVYYRGEQVGEAEIPPGEVAAKGSVESNVVLTVLAGRLVADYRELYSDVVAGSVVFETKTRIPGQVAVMGIFRHRLVTYSDCEVVVGISSWTAETRNCKYHAEL